MDFSLEYRKKRRELVQVQYNERLRQVGERRAREDRELQEMRVRLNEEGTAMGALPNEILRSIFAMATTDTASASHLKAMNAVRGVCGHWKDVVDGDVQLWRTFPALDIESYGQCDEALGLYASNSGNAMMSIFVGRAGHWPDISAEEAERIERRVYKRLISEPGLLERIECLNLVINCVESWKKLVDVETLRRMKNVSNLSIVVGKEAMAFPDLVQGAVFPALTTFGARHLPPNLIPTLHSLTRLWIYHLRVPAELLQAFDACRDTLTDLDLRFSDDDGTYEVLSKLAASKPVRLPSLRRFRCAGGLEHWVPLLHLPNLTKLDFDGECMDEYQTTAFFDEFRSSLLKIVFNASETYDGDFNEYIVDLPNVKAVVIIMKDVEWTHTVGWFLPRVAQELFENMMGMRMESLYICWTNRAGYAHESLMAKKAWTALRNLIAQHETLRSVSACFFSNNPHFWFQIAEEVRGLSSDNRACKVYAGLPMKHPKLT